MKKVYWLLMLVLAAVAFGGGIIYSRFHLKTVLPPEEKLPRGKALVQEKGLGTLGNVSCPAFSELVKKVSPAVVNIYTTKVLKKDRDSFPPFRRKFGWGEPRDPFEEFFERFFDIPQRPEIKQRSLGSGFLISEDGYILTNNHVVEAADEIKVILSDKSRYEAEIVGRDPKTDIALLRVKGGNFPYIRLGDSEQVQVGDWVIAIGNPFGLSHTVTAGIISATGRVIGAGPYDNFIQTDASINFGNSGGPLINLQGEVIGINTAIVARGQGIGFATPINMAKDFLPQLKEKGRVTRGWLGVLIQSLSPEIAESMGLEIKEGALVSQVVKGGPAEKAGIQVGDVIIEFDGKKVTSHHDLPAIVAATPVGKKVKVVVVRVKKGKSETLSLPVTIGELKDEVLDQLSAEKVKSVEQVLGLEVSDIVPDIAKNLGIKDKNGIVVMGVEPGSPAEEVGLQAGDVIREVNRKAIRNVIDFRKEIEKSNGPGAILLLVERRGQTFFVVIEKDRGRGE